LESPRLGVWICDCAGQIDKRLDVGAVEEVARGLPGVVSVSRMGLLCSESEMASIADEIADGAVDRAIIAACSPRVSLRFPEERLEAMFVERGLDPAFFDVADIREQCAWLHKDRGVATAKAGDNLRMSHARITGAEASRSRIPVTRRALVIGGGPAGLQAAQDLGRAGVRATVVEQKAYVGGRMCQIRLIFQTESWPSFCLSDCVGPVHARDTMLQPKVEIFTQSSVVGIQKRDGNFRARILRGAPFVNADQCVSCGLCAEVCPEETWNRYEEGLRRRKAIDKDFERAVPDTYSIVDEACTRCGDCLEVCPTNCIDLEAKPSETEEDYGAVILATGVEPYDLSRNDELSFGLPDVVTGMQFERMMHRDLARPSDGKDPERVVFILCAGSRAKTREVEGVEYCSRTCCSVTVKQAERLATMRPMSEITIIAYHDVRTYERALEGLYSRSLALGLEFVEGQVSGIGRDEEEGVLKVSVDNVDREGMALDEDAPPTVIEADLVVLAAAQVPERTAAPLCDQLGVERDVHGFPIENQVRLFRPTESLVDRVYAVGGSSGPKVIQHAAEQGTAAAAKALGTLSHGAKETGRWFCRIDPAMCSRCRACEAVCPHGAIRIDEESAISDPAFCQACGLCAAACPTRAAQMVNFSDRQVLDQLRVAFTSVPDGEPRILALNCSWCSTAGADLAGVKGLEAPPGLRCIRVLCSSSVSSGLVLQAFQAGADGILVAGCPTNSCHHLWGNYVADKRTGLLGAFIEQMGLSGRRLRFEYLGVPHSKPFIAVAWSMRKDLMKLAPSPIAALAAGTPGGSHG
jgi:heterodisulfide reductase subunit A2